MSILRIEPLGTVKSLDELYALAHLMETEAATCYAELAGQMRDRGDARLAGVLDRLAAEERGHVENVTRWSEHRRGKEPDPAAVRWEPPDPIDPEAAAELSSSRLMTPYRALSAAVRNEERAFAFWSYVAAHAELAEVKSAAEDMAREELQHVALLRRERRRAFHAERVTSIGPTAPSDRAARPPAVDPATLELRLADLLERRLGEFGDSDVGRVRELIIESRRMAGEATPPHLPETAGRNEDPLALAELLVELYLKAAETARDDPALVRAQEFARKAIARLAWLRAVPSL